MIQPIIHQTSPQGRLSWEERRYSARLTRILPGWKHILWGDGENRELFGQIYPQYLKAYDQLPFGVMRADIARYVYMQAMGGIYVDTDYKFLALPSCLTDGWACVLPIEEGRVGNSKFKIGNAVLASEKGHPFWECLIRRIFEDGDAERIVSREHVVAATGPVALTQVFVSLWTYDKSIVLPERNVFFPDRRLFGLSHRGNESTVGFHQCWGSWRGKRSAVAFKNMVRRKFNGLV